MASRAAAVAAALAIAGALAVAVALAAAQSLALAVAVAVAIAAALVPEAGAVAFIAAGSAWLAAAAGVGGLGECESGGYDESGDDGEDRFGFHIVVFLFFRGVLGDGIARPSIDGTLVR